MQTMNQKFSSLHSLQLPRPKRLGNARERGISPSILAMRRDGKREKRRDHKVVDENMVVLKMRIEEMKVKEREEAAAPLIEREWYKNYDSDVYELVGLLQMVMMNNRPSLVLGVVALLVLSSSTSLALVLSYSLRSLM